MQYVLFSLCFVLATITGGKEQTEEFSRADFRKALSAAVNKEPLLEQGLTSKDAAIRRYAALRTGKLVNSTNKLRLLKIAACDSNTGTRLVGVSSLVESFPERSKKTLLMIADTDSDAIIRNTARKPFFSFFHQTSLLRNNPSYDHEVQSLGVFPIKPIYQRGTADLSRNGHTRNFYAVKFDDRNWAGDGDSPLRWCRISFKLPPKEPHHAAELIFSGGKRRVWVWLNGIYIGQYDSDLGQETAVFRLGSTGELKWDKENLLAIRFLSPTREKFGGVISYELLR